MSDTPSIQIDSDWKRQAQEEKRKLAEQTAAKSAPPATSQPSASTQASPERAARQIPAPSFASLIQSTMTQALYYLGEIGDEGEQPMLNLDMAKYHIDTLGVLEAKTKGNLTPDEQSILDQTMYDLRSRFVGIARQMIM
jgi:hypothetical protein